MVTGGKVVHGLDVGAVEAAIRAAEGATSGEIHVSVVRFFFWGDVRRAAERAFRTLHMERTRQRNGVLLFLDVRRRLFAVLGDVGIATRVEPRFWSDLSARLSAALRRGPLTAGVTGAIAELGAELALRFPAEPDQNPNELPDAVSRGD